MGGRPAVTRRGHGEWQAITTVFESRQEITKDRRRLRRAFYGALGFAGLLWMLAAVDSLFDLHLVRHGLLPRRWEGLDGVLWAPLIHRSFGHLFSNTGPLVVLGTALLYGYPRSSRIVLPVVYIGSGLAVWLFARPAFHIGASGLVFGLLFFVLTIGMLRWDRRAIMISLVAFLLYGGMIWGVLPTTPGVSFESHLAGALIGAFLAFRLRDLDPPPPEKRYSWEDEEDEALDEHWPPPPDTPPPRTDSWTPRP